MGKPKKVAVAKSPLATGPQITAAEVLLAAGWTWQNENEFTPDEDGLLYLYAVKDDDDSFGAVNAEGLVEGLGGARESVTVEQAVETGKRWEHERNGVFLGFPDNVLDPECSVCHGSFPVGGKLVVLGCDQIAHESCHEGTKVHAAKAAERAQPPAKICTHPQCTRKATGEDGFCDACSCQGDDFDRCPRDSAGDKLHRPKTKSEALALVSSTFEARSKAATKVRQVKKPERLDAARKAYKKADEAYRFASDECDRIFARP